ncbi:hypothetical protein CA13_69490 [Planctomycetes bacterium CA13]|uniref:Uncharacterized protein n=1 Tax=Novipirellula herctigrandis TaxID=2527986 RepID=A0A5C5YNK8_9BACT|nr:hypothetical protein CA13_69490 [Planctomycetes bacterium CA13]
MNLNSIGCRYAIFRVVAFHSIAMMVACVLLSNPKVAYGQKSSLRALMAAQTPNSDAERKSEQTDVGTTDELLDQAQAEESETTSRDRRRSEHLMALRKPVTSITVATLDPAMETPKNRAAELETEASIVIHSLGLPVPGPDRYTVGFCHQPLYFEQKNLERCGRSYGFFQNAVSMTEFIGRTELWPYHLAAEPMGRCVPTAGECFTCESFSTPKNPFPLDPHGVLLQSAAIAGFVMLLQ